MTIRDRAKVDVPPCPECSAPVHVDWIDVRDVFDPRALWVPGQMRCSTNEDHDVRPLMRTTSAWARERPDRVLFYIDDGPAVEGTLDVHQDSELVHSMGPGPDPNWIFVDGRGHWHAYSEDETEHYPTLDTRSEHVECDGSCGGRCDGEGYHVTRYSCRICGEGIEPGLIQGPYSTRIPTLKSWSAEIVGRLPMDGDVSVRVEVADKVFFGIARCVSTEGGRYGLNEAVVEFRSKLIGVGPLGQREGSAA